ncbi:MAG: glycoside hydrolase N-terminal domain-containing protein, partial [Rothia sp. (in: high G+C Gram-positive bacteria)]|uniref:glycosyl hydrolase family 95 catalytic domain-containing protein n=1 Tax=Rothia sp. (in: high G+C Gram-positive bacteria) TaxID=1885016 RepID=UPI0026DFD7CD
KTLWKGSKGAKDLGSYLTFGDLYIINKAPKSVTDYQRRLSLSQAVGQVDYTVGTTHYTREYLASYPDGVIAIHYRATGAEGIHVGLQLINGQGGQTATYTTEGASFADQVANGMHFRAALSVEQQGGTVTLNGREIVIEGAHEMTLYLTCGTDFDPLQPNHLTGDAAALEQQLAAHLTATKAKGYEAVRADHVADYQQLFHRVKLYLPQARNSVVTPTLLQRTTPEAQAMVDALIFQYGRYLAIASSRGVSLPSNLQGIWCKDGTPKSDAVWASDIHSNVNVQMNYWPVEPTNLSELHMPFLEYIRNEATRSGGTWQQNARDLGAQHGWVVNTAGNIFGGSSNYKLGKYSVANAWYCQHLWQHFTYTRDT